MQQVSAEKFLKTSFHTHILLTIWEHHKIVGKLHETHWHRVLVGHRVFRTGMAVEQTELKHGAACVPASVDGMLFTLKFCVVLPIGSYSFSIDYSS